VKLGAVDYLTKPVDVDDIISALLAREGRKAEAPPHPMSAARVRLMHIRHVHEASGRNVSETARRLKMHRRTLQRILTRIESQIGYDAVTRNIVGSCRCGTRLFNAHFGSK
jgi:two-component system, response regulator RegA